MTLTLTIRLSTSARFTLPASGSSTSITPATTILQVKELISQCEESGRVEVSRQRLIYKGRILSEDNKTLGEYGIQEGGGEPVLYLVKGSGGAAAPSTGSGATPTPAAPPAATSAPTAANPFDMFSNMGQMPSMQQMQQQLQSNPEMMSQMMNNPMVQSLLNNPDFMSQMMESNPQMQSILNANPELRHALRDPEMMRRSMEMMRDPSMMQQMMRNQDLAMSQIENMPGGYNALRRMYEDVQVPMMDAMTGEGGGGQSGGGSQQPQGQGGRNLGAQSQAMPNPWGAATTTTSGASNAQSGSNPAGDSLSNPFAMPNMNMFGGGGANPWSNNDSSTQQLEATIQMLENPLMRQMMDQMMSNPEAVRGLMESNPMMRGLRDTNPQAAAMLENPEMIRAMMNPQTLRAMLQLQQTFSGITPPGAAPSTSSAPPPGGLDFSNLLGSSSTGTVAPNPFLSFPFAPPRTQASSGSSHHPAPGERFRHQLQSLNDMGFTDRSANIRALVSAHGNVNRAIEILLESPPEMGESGGAGSEGDAQAETTAEAVGEQAEEHGSNETEAKGSTEKKND
eukprot:CCRYP_005553-RC/>CCRYP_005553-RC protein AED:0.18 eAED:0.18 QI:0/0.75/0.6/1/0.5/0.4/5/1520/565